MKIEDLKPGMTVYSLSHNKMGNTEINTISVYPVKIIDVDLDSKTVVASWNGNPPQKFFKLSIRSWRIKEPRLIKGPLGNYRLAKRGE